MSASTLMKPVIDHFMNGVPHVRELGIRFSGVGRDWAELELPYAAHLVAYPDTGVIASGAVFSLMDTVGGLSVQAARKRLSQIATVDLRLDYLRPARPGNTVTGYSKVRRLTKSIAFVRGYAHDGERDDPLALMSGCFMVTAGARS